MFTASERRRLRNKFLNPFQPPETFPVNRNSLRGLKWIGPHFRQQLRDNGIASWNKLEQYFERHKKRENAAFLKECLANTRADQCIDSERGWRDFNINREYKVRPVNWFAYNSVLYYARSEFSALAGSRLPVLMKRQRAKVAFPTTCPAHH